MAISIDVGPDRSDPVNIRSQAMSATSCRSRRPEGERFPMMQEVFYLK